MHRLIFSWNNLKNTGKTIDIVESNNNNNTKKKKFPSINLKSAHCSRSKLKSKTMIDFLHGISNVYIYL